MFDNLLCHEAIVAKPHMKKDEYDNDIPDYDDIENIKLKCRIYYKESNIVIDNNQSLTTKGQYKLSSRPFYFGKFDRILWNNYIFEPDGEPALRYKNAALHHITINLKLIQ